MLLENSLELAIPPEQLMPLLEDLERIAPCLPGASITERVDESTFKGRVTVRVGPVTVRYDGTMSILEVDRVGHKMVMRGEGRDPQGAGNAKATITMTLAPSQGGGSIGTIQSDVAITGRVAQFGRGLMQDVADRLLTQFAQCVERTLTASPPLPPSSSAPRAAHPQAAPSGPESAPPQSVGMIGIVLAVIWKRLRGIFQST
jgi:carbon monoxide dehydrogenase subunit G